MSPSIFIPVHSRQAGRGGAPGRRWGRLAFAVRRTWPGVVALCMAIALALPACSSPTWKQVNPVATGNGVELTLISLQLIQPYPAPIYPQPPGTTCVSYQLQARATDGERHDLRPTDLRSSVGDAAAAIGRCPGDQLEPTWVGSRPTPIAVTLLVSGDDTLWVRL